MRELERQHDDKLNIIRSMAIPINTHVAETCATPAGKGTPRRRPPTPYAESTKLDAEEELNGNEKYRMVAYEHTEVVQVKKRCQSEERLLQVMIIFFSRLRFLIEHVCLVIRSITFVTTRSRGCTKVSFSLSNWLVMNRLIFLDDFVCKLDLFVFY